MNSIDTFTTTAGELLAAATDIHSDAVFVAVDDVELNGVKGTRAIFPTRYGLNNGQVTLELGEYGERTYSLDDQVTWHVLRHDIKF
ncbi:hypothetical protein GS463_25845 [Rhodococcus hoagii]|uniref:Uncharacterized protein n=1 Tax=Rhodococcus hoagii TaxID=43767 RepID=A0AAE3BBN4_RHOHA|nr:hypothetical protein [Prescottella equi]MBM4542405.1 hypothetical protein [Prescottella equi]MBM4715828.1 hypothetical protein [Prescottella equi]NKS14009.1 hypothetical protein [Prescottella equi]